MKLELKRVVAVAGLLVGAGGIPTQVMAERPLTVVSWGGSVQEIQKQVYFKPFAASTGQQIIDETWNGGLGVIRSKVEAGTDSGWDVVQVESEDLQIGCEEGLYETIDWSKVGGKGNYIDMAVSDCGVGTAVFSVILAYDKNKLSNAPTGWADFFDTKKFPGKRALNQSPKWTLEIALMADGVKPADVYSVLSTPQGVDRAFAKLDTIKNNVIWWKSGAQPSQLLASGEVAMAAAYNGRIDTANRDDKRNFGIVWNGALTAIDSWVILKTSPYKDAAYKYLNFVGRPENQAKYGALVAYGVTSKGANDVIDPKRLADLPTSPEHLKMSVATSDKFWIENFDRLSARFNTWAAN